MGSRERKCSAGAGLGASDWCFVCLNQVTSENLSPGSSTVCFPCHSLARVPSRGRALGDCVKAISQAPGVSLGIAHLEVALLHIGAHGPSGSCFVCLC